MNNRALWTAVLLVAAVLLLLLGVFYKGHSVAANTRDSAPERRAGPGSSEGLAGDDTEPAVAGGRESQSGFGSWAMDANGPPATFTGSRDAAMQEIFEASIGHSSKRVDILAKYLGSHDSAIRTAAIDAMIQIKSPESSEALRNAAERANARDQRMQLLKAADLVDLPAYKPKSWGTRPPAAIIQD